MQSTRLLGWLFPGVPRPSARSLPRRWLTAAKQLVRRGEAAAPVTPRRPRLVLLQIDGLSSRRLRQALARGEMPHLARWLASGQARLSSLRAASPPSTPVFTAGLLYGARGGIPGFGWFDRALGRQVRMDLAEDVSALEQQLLGRRRPLLADGVSYGTIWPGGAATCFFNVVRFAYGATSTGKRVCNAWDRLVSTAAGVGIAGRLASRFVLELAVGLWDFVRWCRRIRSTQFEWRFLYMRLFVSVVMRDVATQAAVLDILRGVPRIFIDYLGYDEYAHRRGPDSELALYNLQGIDKAIARLRRAVSAVPEYGYDIFVLSDHGQTASLPFERVVGRSLSGFVLENVRAAETSGSLQDDDVRRLVSLRTTEFWTRTLPKGLRGPARLYVAWLRRRVRRQVDERAWRPIDAIEVVTGGSIAHIYFDHAQRRLTIDEIERRHPALLDALASCPAIGLIVGRGKDGPSLFYRGQRYRLGDRRRLAPLPPFRRVGYDLLAAHLLQAAEGDRYGDLVLYGAFAEAGDVAFDFEFGSHGGVGPDELDQFLIAPAEVVLPPALRTGQVTAEQFYRFFSARYGDPAEEVEWTPPAPERAAER